LTQSSPEPIENLTIDDSKVTLLGTAHVSQASADMVEQLIDSKAYQAVAVELCPSRYQALVPAPYWGYDGVLTLAQRSLEALG